MLFTLANLFRADQMIRQWEDLTKTGNNALNGEETGLNRLIQGILRGKNRLKHEEMK